MLVLGVKLLDHMTRQHDSGLSDYQPQPAQHRDTDNSHLRSDMTINPRIHYLTPFPP